MSTRYILVRCTISGACNPSDFVSVRFFNKKENARKAMEAAYREENAYQKAKAAMYDTDNPMEGDYSVDRSPSSITIHAGMDTFHWEIMAAKPEDEAGTEKNAHAHCGKAGRSAAGNTKKSDEEIEHEGLYVDP